MVVIRPELKRDWRLVLLVILAVPSSAMDLGQATFRARMIAGAMRGGAIDIRINIESYSSAEELLQLERHYSLADTGGFFSAFRAMKKGSLGYVGSQGLNIQLRAAREQQTEKGVRIIIAAESRNIIPGLVKKRIYKGLRFLVIVLDLDEKLSGDGRIYQDATVRFTREDIELDSSLSPPVELTDVRLTK